MKRKSAILVSLLCFLSATASANVHVVDRPAFGGEAQVLQVLDNEGQPAPGTEVHGVYYPASEIEEKVKVCVTDADGRTRMEMRWDVPGDAGPRRAAAAAA